MFMRQLNQEEIKAVSGGNPILAIGIAWGLANVGWQFYQGYRDGYNRTMAN